MNGFLCFAFIFSKVSVNELSAPLFANPLTQLKIAVMFKSTDKRAVPARGLYFYHTHSPSPGSLVKRVSRHKPSWDLAHFCFFSLALQKQPLSVSVPMTIQLIDTKHNPCQLRLSGRTEAQGTVT